MTFSVNGNDIGQAIEIAIAVGSIIAMLVVGLLVYLVVRPPRRRTVEVQVEPDAIEAEEMLQLMERMERRLEVLERAVGDDAGPAEDQLLEEGERPKMRRTK